MTGEQRQSDGPGSAAESGIGRVEFHRGLNLLERVNAQTLARETDGLRESFGWVAISLGIWLLVVGYYAVSDQLRGGPRG